jgi:anti-sigma B factor antagonist
MPLQVSTRTVGNIALVQCNGRIVAGDAAALEAEVRKCFSEFLSVVVDLKDVSFIDSSGLGLLVRLVTATRTTDMRMNLCAAGPAVEKLLTMTNLSGILQNHPSSDDAMRAIQAKPQSHTPTDTAAPLVLCVHESIDLLAWLRESLGRRGFQIQTASAAPDATILIKARRPKLVVSSSALKPKIVHVAEERNIAVLQFHSDFAMQDSTKAIDDLLKQIKEALA